ncbi:MAG TPA: hypothetical protein VGR06_33920 [Actinophytocola sp.]|jgi:O-antigen/teichoic acid export membrane protein|uniref:lipopolysaccharide biosynthesis protein n=1 Tax=Actinophytocola sp. TaxID=1872138 RepID=UPI002E081111|nr:hypothetical protein [Actinophytocola sp.]
MAQTAVGHRGKTHTRAELSSNDLPAAVRCFIQVARQPDTPFDDRHDVRREIEANGDRGPHLLYDSRMSNGLTHRFGSVGLMVGGLVLVGAAGYGFIALSGYTLSAADAAALASLYLLVNIIGPGLFFALEQEISRSTSTQLTAGNRIGPVARRGAVLTFGVLIGVLAILVCISPVLVNRVLAGNWWLGAAVMVSVSATAAVYLVRGLLGGVQRFTGYAVTLAVEGIARLLPCVAIAASGAPSAVGYSMIFAAGAGFGALAGLPWLVRAARAEAPHIGGGYAVEPAGFALPGHSVGRMARRSSLLIGGTLLMQLVPNLAPIVVTARLAGDAATAAAFASAFILVRIPLFLFTPVQSMLLPTLTKAATIGDLPAFRAKLRLNLLAVAAVGLPAALLSLLVGPWAVQLLFGAQVRLSGTVVGLLGISTVILMIAQVLQPGLVALDRHFWVTIAWVLGTTVLVGMLALPGNPLRAAVIAQFAGSLLVAVTMVAAVVNGLRRSPARAVEVAAPAR